MSDDAPVASGNDYESSSLEESSGLEEQPAVVEAREDRPKKTIPRVPSAGHVPSFAPPPPPDEDAKDASEAPDVDDGNSLERAAVLAQSWRRRAVAQRRYQMQGKRLRVAQELLETEETYVAGLELMIRLYQKPLLASARSTDPILPRARVQQIFSVVEVMTNLNKVLLEDLKQRLDSWHAEQLLGDIFLTMGDYLKVATQYVNNYDTAIKVIREELKSNERFTTFYNEMRETPECRKNDLKAYLIMPVQRIPRYEMLLRELIRKTPRDHADYQPLEGAYAKIQSISALIDSRKDSDVKFKEVLRVHALFEPRVPNLVAPTRRFVSDDAFMLLPGEGAPSKQRPVPVQCVLFNDWLVVADRIEEGGSSKKQTMRNAAAATAATVRYRPRKVYALPEIQCSLGKECILLSSTKQDGPPLVLGAPPSAATAEDRGTSHLVAFVKRYSQTRSELESNASASGLSLRPSRMSSGDMPVQPRTPSDPSSTRVPVKPQTRSEPRPMSRRLSGQFASKADALDESPLTTKKTEEEIQHMAEQTKQGTIGVLQTMVAEMDAKVEALNAKVEAAQSDEERESLVAERAVLQQKAKAMRQAMEAQASASPPQLSAPPAGSNPRMRSSSEAAVARPRSTSGFNLRSSPAASPADPPAKKGLFATIRTKNRRSSIGESNTTKSDN